jgi:hypothetical protein
MFASNRSLKRSLNALRPALAVAAVLAVTLPDCGGSNPTAPPPANTTPAPPPATLPPTPTTLADLTAALTSPQANGSINCTGEVRARVTLNNRGGTPVNVTALLDTTGIPAGDCFGGGDRTFRFSPPRAVLPGGTTVLLDQSIYNDTAFCCRGRGCAGACTFQEAFQVITDVGNVPAGSFNYKVFFQNCPSCPTTAGARAVGNACAGMAAGAPRVVDPELVRP